MPSVLERLNILEAHVGKLNSFEPVAGTVGVIVDNEALTAQTTNIGSSNFVNAATIGTYLATYYLVCTTAAGTAGTLLMTLAWNDGSAAQTISSSAINLTILGSFTQGVIKIRLGSGAISFSTTVTGIYSTSQYSLYMTLMRLS